jgi:hypothetical protein
MSGRVALLLFIDDNLNFVTRHRTWHEDDFAIRTPNTSWPVGQRVNCENACARRHGEEENQKKVKRQK